MKAHPREENTGLRTIMRNFNSERLGMSAAAVPKR